MSTLRFDGNAHTITLFDDQNHQVGQWDANNVVDRSATLRFVPDGDYQILDTQRPHTHGGGADSLNGSYGRFGIIRMEQFDANGVSHDGVGIHSGRDDQGAQNHPTMGCIRTTDAAMQSITQYILRDPVTSISIQGNHDQHTRLSPHRGDHHRHHHPTPTAPSSTPAPANPNPGPPPSNSPMT